jgi:hypothetical protein
VVKLISGPDFENSSIFVFDIDGTQLSIPVPEDALDDTMSADASIKNLTDNETYDVLESDYMPIKRVLKTQFRYVDTVNELALESTSVMFRILKVDNFRPIPQENLLHKHEVRRVFFHILCDLKKSLENDGLEKAYFVFPESEEDIKEINCNQIHWLIALNGFARIVPPEHTFVTPITNNHLLMIDINTGTYPFGTDEQSAQIRAEAEADVFDFIRSIRIEFSPEVQAEIDEVRGAMEAL